MILHLNDDEKKVIFWILSNRCFKCDDLLGIPDDCITYLGFCQTCTNPNCQYRKTINELVSSSEHLSFKDLMKFDCDDVQIIGWQQFFKYRKGWAS